MVRPRLCAVYMPCALPPAASHRDLAAAMESPRSLSSPVRTTGREAARLDGIAVEAGYHGPMWTWPLTQAQVWDTMERFAVSDRQLPCPFDARMLGALPCVTKQCVC